MYAVSLNTFPNLPSGTPTARSGGPWAGSSTQSRGGPDGGVCAAASAAGGVSLASPDPEPPPTVGSVMG
jgi:hypothetical protein